MNHILINVIDNQIECKKCGAFYKISFKKPINEYTQLINAFVKDHKHIENTK